MGRAERRWSGCQTTSVLLMVESVPGGTRHLQEVVRELTGLTETLGNGLESVSALLAGVSGDIYASGSGASGFIAERFVHLLRFLGIRAHHLPPSNGLHGGMGAIAGTDVLVAFSCGGESADLNDLVIRLKDRGVSIVAITAASSTPLAQEADLVILTGDVSHLDIEGVVGTGSGMVQLAIGDALIHTLVDLIRVDWKHLGKSHPAGAVGDRLARWDTKE